MKHSVGVVLGVLVVGAVALAAPKLVVEPSLYDFGTVMDGVVIQFNVVLTNAGDATLQISGVSYNCSCTGYQLPKRTLAPGESVTMAVTFRTAGYSRYPQPVSQALTVSSNDPINPRQVIEVRGVVRQLAAHEGAASTFDNGFYVLVDLRSPADYARGHLLGAMNIPFAELQARLGELPRTKVIYLYDATGIEAAQAAQLLQQNGYIPRAISGGLVGWWLALGDVFFVWAPDAERNVPGGTPYHGSFAAEQPTRLATRFQYVVDLRPPEVYAQGRFPGADNVSLLTAEDVAAWAATLPRPPAGTSLAIWIVDEDGSQACSIAQYLQSVGFTGARCLFGGLAGWRASYGDTLLFPSP